MADQIVDSLFHFIINFHILKEIFYQLRTFFFLVGAVCITIFYAAYRAGNVVDHGCDFQNFLLSFGQIFHLANHSGICIYLQEMGNIMLVSIGICDHFCDNIIYGLLCFCHVFSSSFAFKKRQKSSGRGASRVIISSVNG